MAEKATQIIFWSLKNVIYQTNVDKHSLNLLKDIEINYLRIKQVPQIGTHILKNSLPNKGSYNVIVQFFDDLRENFY